ncbi:SirB2 family protein [Massilia sp. R2A-15]|uniref:SirB2 family protein n=1 Tax=Massilia sp. R2A-15 TaxID=3064278 RepID=UPI0028044130|nr:SirB2 family protein [Massilia sp. R2A-15]
MIDYLTLKHFHMSCAAASGSLFLVRGAWMLRESPRLHARWVRVAPHIIDTLLLASAITLAVWSGQYPGAQGWLTAKVAALIAYIVLGTIALKRGRTKMVRFSAFLAALAVFGYIVAVAVTKQPNPFG